MPYAPKRYTVVPRRRREECWVSRQMPWRHWYGLAIWKRENTGLRALVLARDPTCVECLKQKLITPSVHADHIRPFNGDWDLFVDLDNLQGLCAACHSRKTMAEQSR